MAFLIGALLAALAIAVVLYPFIKVRLRSPMSPAPDSSDHASMDGLPDPRGREEVYEDIKALQLEYELGGVEEEEFRDRLRAYRLQAAATLRDHEQLERELDSSLETEILAARAFHGSEHSLNGDCRSCGRPLAHGTDEACLAPSAQAQDSPFDTAQDRSCPHCGVELVPDTPVWHEGGGPAKW